MMPILYTPDGYKQISCLDETTFFICKTRTILLPTTNEGRQLNWSPVIWFSAQVVNFDTILQHKLFAW